MRKTTHFSSGIYLLLGVPLPVGTNDVHKKLITEQVL